MAIVVATSAMAACTGGTQSPPVPDVQPAAATPAPLTIEDLETAPVPSVCEHPAGSLVDGALPLVPDQFGGVWLSRDADGAPRYVETALTGDGPEFLALLDCSQGGVGWPQVVVLYGSGPTLLGSLVLGDVELGPPYGGLEHVAVMDWHAVDGGVEATIVNYAGAGFDAVTWTGVFHLQDGSLTLDDLAYVSGPEEL